eukprot:1158203-Pelagomonas_calceolata.AAC.11
MEGTCSSCNRRAGAWKPEACHMARPTAFAGVILSDSVQLFVMQLRCHGIAIILEGLERINRTPIATAL